MKGNTTTRPCFSCGSECADWLDRNCENCIKASRTKDGGYTYTKGRCVYQKDIFLQFSGFGNEEIRQKTHYITQFADCPFRAEHNKKRKNRKQDNSPTLF